MEDGAEHGDLPALNGPRLEQIRVRQLRQEAIDSVERALEIGKQHRAGGSGTGGEFRGTLPRVRPSADAAKKPLADVAVQMQQEIADAVRLIVRAPPERILGQCLDGESQLRAV